MTIDGVLAAAGWVAVFLVVVVLGLLVARVTL